MVRRHLAGRDSVDRTVAIVVLLCVVAAMSAQAFHFHCRSEAGAANHCPLCEADSGPLPVAIDAGVFASPVSRFIQAVAETDQSESTLGSNLFVRPPPS